VRRWLREVVLYRWLRRATQLARYLAPQKKMGFTAAEADTVFPPATRCMHCGGWHMHACPRIRSIKFLGENPVEIEFWPHGAWPVSEVVFPWQKAALITEEVST